MIVANNMPEATFDQKKQTFPKNFSMADILIWCYLSINKSKINLPDINSIIKPRAESSLSWKGFESNEI